jgi:hypothetical protein
MEKRDDNFMLLNAQAEGLAARILLDELRAGRVAVALELLEQRLDTSVLAINGFSREVSPERKASAVESLRILRQYRERHPRKTEAVIDAADDGLDMQETQKKVKRILDETNDA